MVATAFNQFNQQLAKTHTAPSNRALYQVRHGTMRFRSDQEISDLV